MGLLKSQPKISADQDRTRIIISFAMANNGAMFAHWLRNQLMQRCNLFGMKTVYMDCVVSREITPEPPEGDTTSPRNAQLGERLDKAGNVIAKNDPTAIKQSAAYKAGLFGVVQIEDEGSKNSTANRRCIGAHRENWNPLFWKGMSEAEVMVMVLNKEYVASVYCLQEWGQFADNNRLRLAERRKPLRGIALRLDETPIPMPDMQQFVTPVKAQKCYGAKESVFKWDAGDYTLNESDMNRLVRAIGKLD
ncbi:MAG TPA: hypothetical protein VHV55_03540 [Pirellulales bacterium]|jgi:hypothetical protein|nr:hypothetical protein [Pirellulales bacterium]